MKKHAFYGIYLLAALSLAAVQAKANLIYDNGPINGAGGFLSRLSGQSLTRSP